MINKQIQKMCKRDNKKFIAVNTRKYKKNDEHNQPLGGEGTLYLPGPELYPIRNY